MRFVNPSDPTGINGLAATEYETYFQTNAASNYFTGFSLLTNVDYVSIASTNADGSITADGVEFGPVGGILSGQEAIIVYTAAIQPSAGADLSLSASAAPEPVGVGSNLVYSITVSNAGPATATGVIVSNQLPANVTFVSATGGATPSSGVLLLNLGALAVDATNSVQIVVQPTAAGRLTNAFQVFANEFDPNLTNNSTAVVSTVTNAPVVSQVIPIPGTPVSTNWNPGGSTVLLGEGGGIGVQPILDFGVPFTATPGDVVMLIDPNGGTNTSNWKAVVNFFNPSDPTGTNGLVATEYQTFFPTNAGPNYFASFPLFTNVAYVPIASTNADGSITANYEEYGPSAGGFYVGQKGIIVYTAAIQPSAGADLSLTASAAPEPVGVGSNLVYSLTVSNAGPAAATGVMVSNQLPAGVTFVSATGGATPSSGVLLLNLGSLATGVITNAQIIVQPTAGGKLTNLFQVFANETDPVLTNNSATVVSTVTNAAVVSADLSLSARAAPEPVIVGSNLVYTIAITNRGPSAASGVVVSNRIPANVNFISATGGSTPAGGVLLVNLGPLAAGATNSAQVIVQPTVAGKLTNLFQVFANETDPVLTNNFATVTSTVTNGPPLPVDVALSIMAAPNPVSVGAPLTYSLTVTNNSSTTATGVVVSNTLPPNVTVFSLLPSEGTASNHAGVVTYTVGSLPNGIANTLAIVVIPNAAGLLTNIAVVSSTQTDSQPLNNRVTNVTTAVSVPITNLVLTVLSAMTLNPQTGLFELRVQVANGGPATPSSVLVMVSGLAANAHLYNATGITNGTPFVQSASPLGIGSNIIFLLEFYVPTRVPPANLTYTVQAGPPMIPPVASGTILNISRTPPPP